MDDIYKPLKNMVENHSKVRKPVSTFGYAFILG